MRFGVRSIPIEYYTLRVLAPAVEQICGESAVIGYFADRPIFETVTDTSGDRYHYVGLAPRLSDGRYDIESLAQGEWIVEPGLIYRLENPVCEKRTHN
ncbi:MAG: hypothetical protein EOS81_07910 [Mesorhizobium sp.]|nr:hypothetical protein EJ072_20110 [Mesorhizobium sp. M2A.F.Ca.ET.046.03.2.1]RUW81239.1 hypothetical protein EOA28_02095 [Mesorhizobium sp. M2A.F.Ca.ET.067.02.1.1]RVC70925.1 hypothetical protein EN759_02070 [Mesorhizobium sp. M00.F.Ca.ET.038.03.1.1]RVC81926.1 hypothetical protein EN766_02210 [Mesorhizobium sp. M2A.F.Ca.ET.046.02.1.1]RWB45182.1 MAG: hypothetical protein EOQ44_13975 [Mesorhizobium sp.]